MQRRFDLLNSNAAPFGASTPDCTNHQKLW